MKYLDSRWIIYDEHWESHAVATFNLVKGTDRSAATYHLVGDYFYIPKICRAKTIQQKLF